MEPLSHDLPKPLMPVWGRPALARVLDLVSSWGVREIMINCHHGADHIMEFVHAYPKDRLHIAVSFEADILGTGGALRQAQWFLDGHPFWILNADIVARLDPSALWHAYRRHRPLSAVWLDRARGPLTVETAPNGAVVDFRSTRPGTEGTGTLCGLHLVSHRIFDYLPPEVRFSSIVPAYERAIQKGERVLGVSVPGAYWSDIGTPEQYLDTHRELLELQKASQHAKWIDSEFLTRMKSLRTRGIRIDGFAALDEGVQVADDVHLENVVAWDGAVIRKGSRVRNAIAGRATSISGEVSDVLMPAARVLRPAETRALDRMGRRPDRATAQVLPARGSARSFIRLATPRSSIMLVRYSTERKENLYYARHAMFLHQLGLRVPELLLRNTRSRFLLMEDIGNDSLERLIPDLPRAQVLAHYRKTLDAIALLHDRGAAAARRERLPLMPGFTSRLYGWEHELFLTHFVQKDAGIKGADMERIRNELQGVAERLKTDRQVLIHRDLQSSNVFVRRGQPAFIDFQGMRMGPVSYDIASLLCDPYVELDHDVQDVLLKYYTRGTNIHPDHEEFFWWGAIQRLVQASGAFSRLSALPGCQRFAVFHRPAFRILRRALTRLDTCPCLRGWVDHWLDTLPTRQRGRR